MWGFFGFERTFLSFIHGLDFYSSGSILGSAGAQAASSINYDRLFNRGRIG